MGCVFCKKLEPGTKEDVGLQGDFRGSGAVDHYGPDPTQARPVSSFVHIPNYNNFPTQSTSTPFLDGGVIRGISGESGGWEAGPAWILGKPGGKGDVFRSLQCDVGNTARLSEHSLRGRVYRPTFRNPVSRVDIALFPSERGTLMTDPSGKSWRGRGVGDLGTPQGGWDGLEGMCPESTWSQAVRPKSELHCTPKAFGNQSLRQWGGIEPV